MRSAAARRAGPGGGAARGGPHLGGCGSAARRRTRGRPRGRRRGPAASSHPPAPRGRGSGPTPAGSGSGSGHDRLPSRSPSQSAEAQARAPPPAASGSAGAGPGCGDEATEHEATAPGTPPQRGTGPQQQPRHQLWPAQPCQNQPSALHPGLSRPSGPPQGGGCEYQDLPPSTTAQGPVLPRALLGLAPPGMLQAAAWGQLYPHFTEETAAVHATQDQLASCWAPNETLKSRHEIIFFNVDVKGNPGRHAKDISWGVFAAVRCVMETASCRDGHCSHRPCTSF
ncbi:basic salivary proline-rich protein 2-like isoform X2 [Pongo pygmaeus]|uniref:basic salivary proline-rich protein 2-like isoform X2 n=1 Tax=Pongo pygmaeus TaxID=9600 RepID=UPI00300CBBBB